MTGSRRVAMFAWSLVAVSVLFTIADQVMVLTTPPLPAAWPSALYLPAGIAFLTFPVVGALIAARRPNHPIGWLLLSFGVLGSLHVAAQSYRDLAVIKDPDRWPAGDYAAWLTLLLLIAKMAVLLFLVLLYPDGRPASRVWRWLIGALGVYVLVNLAAAAFAPGPFVEFPRSINPVGLSGVTGEVFQRYVSLGCPKWLWPLGLALGVVSLVLRYRRAGWQERQQIKWFALGVAVAAVGVLAVVLTQGAGPEDVQRPELIPVAAALVLVAVIALPGSIGYALLRHRLLDINLAVSRSLVYAVLTVVIGAAYFGGAAALGIAAGGDSQVILAVLVTVAAVLAFHPLRRRLDRAAARLVYGHRLSGYDLLTQFGEALEHAFSPTELGGKVAETVRDGLRLQWARVSLEFPANNDVVRETVAAVGVVPDDPVRPEKVVALVHAGESLGTIECGPKTTGSFADADERLLESLARQSALAFHNGRLAAELTGRLDEIRRQAEELAASRSRIVHAQDVERRRLERNLHDGVQQEILGLLAKLRLARNQLRRDPTLADGTLDELHDDITHTLDSIRELAHGIHPAVLSDQGLVAAIEGQLRRLPGIVSLHVAPHLRGTRFDDEIEAAAYFVVAEAVSNSLKHAKARNRTVRIDHRDAVLSLQIADDGTGFVAGDTAGSGLTGIRDRIEALHGKIHLISAPGRGTTMTAELPATVRSAAAAPQPLPPQTPTLPGR